jgi:hypothetical protein
MTLKLSSRWGLPALRSARHPCTGKNTMLAIMRITLCKMLHIGVANCMVAPITFLSVHDVPPVTAEIHVVSWSGRV